MSKKKLKSSNKSFGILFFIVFFLYGIWPIVRSNEIRFWSILLGIIFLALGLLNSNILSPLNRYWVKFGELLGKIISPVVMAFVYFIIITPLAIIVRLLGKDLLKTKFNKSSSYWMKRLKNIGSMKKQF